MNEITEKLVKYLTGQLSIEAFPEYMRPRVEEMGKTAAEMMRNALFPPNDQENQTSQSVD